jgi:hypothetical protein
LCWSFWASQNYLKSILMQVTSQSMVSSCKMVT